MAVGFASLLVLRVLFGMAEGPLCAGANKMVNNWMPHDIAATSMGLLSAGSPLGGAIAGPVIGLLAISFGWRPAFWIICGIGLVWCVAWMLLTADRPSQSRFVSTLDEAEPARRRANVAHTPHTVPDSAASVPLSAWLRQPLVIAAAVAFFAYN